METKICTKCNLPKDLNTYTKNKNANDGYNWHCGDCRKEYRQGRKEITAQVSKIYNTKNKEKIKEGRKDYLKKTAIQRNEKRRANYEKNKEAMREYGKKVYKERNGKEKLRKKRAENREKYNEYARNGTLRNKVIIRERHLHRMETDPLYASKIRIRRLIKNSINHKGFKAGSKAVTILGCDYAFFRSYLESQFKKGMNWKNIHIDHIKPMASAKTEEDVIILNHYTNFQPLFIADNLSKRDKLITKQLRLL